MFQDFNRMDDKESLGMPGVSLLFGFDVSAICTFAAGLRTTNGCTHLHLEKDARGVSCVWI